MAIFSDFKDKANSKCSYFNIISVTKMQLGQSVLRAIVFRKMPFEPRFWLPWQRRGGAKWRKNFIFCIFSTSDSSSNTWIFLKWCQICMYFSFSKIMISCLHIAPFLGSSQPRFFFRRGALTPPSNPSDRGGHIPPLGPPWNVSFSGGRARKKAQFFKQLFKKVKRGKSLLKYSIFKSRGGFKGGGVQKASKGVYIW